MTGIVDDIKSSVNDILGIRDDIGAIKHLVYILTRTWTGERLGSGTATDVKVQILPTPWLVDYSHNLRLREGGSMRQGDMLIKHLSKQSYPLETDIDCSVSANNIEKFYFINERLYQVISIVDDYVYWNVQARKTSKQTTYF